jgi:hypothetical protein
MPPNGITLHSELSPNLRRIQALIKIKAAQFVTAKSQPLGIRVRPVPRFRFATPGDSKLHQAVAHNLVRYPKPLPNLSGRQSLVLIELK